MQTYDRILTSRCSCMVEVGWIADHEAAKSGHADTLPKRRHGTSDITILIAILIAVAFVASIVWGVTARSSGWIMHLARDRQVRAAKGL